MSRYVKVFIGIACVENSLIFALQIAYGQRLNVVLESCTDCTQEWLIDASNSDLEKYTDFLQVKGC